MNHKRAVKKLMGCGFSRNEANIELRWYNERKWSNKNAVHMYLLIASTANKFCR